MINEEIEKYDGTESFIVEKAADASLGWSFDAKSSPSLLVESSIGWSIDDESSPSSLVKSSLEIESRMVAV
eukprot:CAMPEP_0117743264 /NCGR_PEP_ID=MMETSP0947-20121206/6031_1 /TAXON_ID=44440 /ORGANISM="Chattonella subsalsa, Strain CCMP2191" /LENGTH=70 /DNA_ID=CAMNT_0005559931 /DNA_START=611 /DNA_END=823 /DNA_ORIENTATION=-